MRGRDDDDDDDDDDSLFSVRGKTVLITGGAKGVGLMLTETFVERGCRVCIASRHREDGERTRERLNQSSNNNNNNNNRGVGSCDFIRADLSTEDGCKNLAEEFKRRYESLDVLINNSGVAWGEAFETHSEKGFYKTHALNVVAPFILIREFADMMESSGRKRGTSSRVINIGSIAGLKPQVFPTFSYDASKAALHHLSTKLADALSSRNITVNVLALGFFPTKMTDSLEIYGKTVKDDIMKNALLIKRVGRASDVGGAAVYLASEAGSWVTGSVLKVDGGFLSKL